MTKSSFALFASLALVACKGGDSDTPVDSDPPTGCATVVDDVTPSDGATNVYYRGTIDFEFSDADTSATVSLSQGGTDVPGTSTWVGDVLVFEPNSPLTPSTPYEWTLTFCDGGTTATGTFTTGAVGTPAPEGDLPGTTYVLDIASGNFIQPPNVGALLQQQLTVDILIGVITAGGGNIEMLGALAVTDSNPPTQDDCLPTIDFPIADFSENPYFEVGPQNTTINIQGIAITIDDLFVSGAFAPDGSAIAGAVLAGQIDTRPLVGLVGEEGDPEDTVCVLVEGFGVACEPCAAGGNFCLSLLVNNIAAGEVPGETISPISTEEAAINCPPPAN